MTGGRDLGRVGMALIVLGTLLVQAGVLVEWGS